VPERDRERRETAREATNDGSRRSGARSARFGAAKRVALGVIIVGAIAALLLVITEFSTVASVDVAGGSCELINDTDPELADRCTLTGFDRNGGSFLLLAALVLVMAWGAGLGGSRPAAIALAGVGVLVVGWALFVDLPVTSETGAIGLNFEGARAAAGPGLTLELVAGALALGAGVTALVAPSFARSSPSAV
jgi:hypothetical protein